MIKDILTLCILFVCSVSLRGQVINQPSNLYEITSNVHTSIRDFNPYAYRLESDSIIQSLQIQSNFAQNKWIGRKLLNENLVHIKNEEYNIILNPLMNFSLGSDDAIEERIYVNRRGVQVRGNITEKFSFYTDFLETQARFPEYVTQFADQTQVIPGQGRFKRFGDNGAKDFGIAQGFLDYQANKYFGLQFGNGKNFIGDGYRSFLLSNNAFNYPYLKLSVNIWKLKYVVLYTQMKDINNRYTDGTFFNKYTTSHFLSYNVNKRWNVGFYETVTYADESGDRGYDISYLNPIIFYRPVEFALGSSGGNVLLGFNTKYKITNNVHAYGQFSLDELNTSKISEGDDWWANKFAWQIGFKSFNTFIPNLTVQSEINFARPFIYSHQNEIQSYTNYNQSITHPLGSNFIEYLSIVQYRHKRFYGSLQFIFAQKGLNPVDQETGDIINLGSDLLISSQSRFQEFNNTFLQGDLASTTFIDAKIGYIINPNYNLVFELGLTSRNYTVENNPAERFENNRIIQIGLKTDLFRYYYDF